MSAKNGSDAGRASRRVPLVPLTVLAALTLAGAAACSSSSSTASAGGGSSSTATSAASGSASASSTGSASAALAPFLQGKKATGTPVKIGLINNEGSSAVAEPATGDAAVAAADYANDELGGIAGHSIQVDRCSESEDTASATACANKMVQDNVAAVVIGTTGFGNTMVPIITKAGIPYVSATGSSSAELTTAGTFMWTGGFPADLGGMAKYAASQGIKKVTAYVINAPSALEGAQSVGGPLFKAAGVALTIEPVPYGVADATPQVTAGLAGKPGAAAIVADASTCTSILKALTTVSPGLPTMGNTSCLNTSTLTALGSAMNGVRIMGRSATQSDDGEAQLYRYVMAKYYPADSPSGDAVTGYQGMLGLIRALSTLTGDPTPATITTAIKAAKDVPVPAGAGLTFTCDGKAMAGLTSNCSGGDVVLTVQDGKATNPQVIK
ncbi:ABC transporter substrate-binding protein [Trebonia kvetii]|uniref:ABC transporter substrate-binding protein n=1 Tax=Trebonia kvetii TaxID=2480626 RepID=A0A6P2BVS7_9ACTN|nr:ABC transporter substrate-binding protein [Trebonia kvetii]TVZ02401.1 ABC transporter substrate-binding protein [Trebonia kvetii]